MAEYRRMHSSSGRSDGFSIDDGLFSVGRGLPFSLGKANIPKPLKLATLTSFNYQVIRIRLLGSLLR